MKQPLRLLRNARREALLVLAAWAAFFAWVVTTSYARGYSPPDPAALTTVLGVPEWIWLGVFLPWLVATAVTIVFGWKVIADDDLGADRSAEKD